MSSREFAYWLQGYFEINPQQGNEGLSKRQVEIIRNHLNLVFHHEIDPSYSNSSTEQATLNQIHDGVAPQNQQTPIFMQSQDPNKPLMRC